ncbi:MAG TPA: response regulator transcription factor [Lacunisphaera sp.]|jgi:DNA-binding NarL/FixJ family response regulator|nr:response regulator transcription factor [Lacunisphaera sp.]
MTTSKPITILLAEDHAIVRQGLGALLKADGQFRLVGETRTGREAVALARSLRPDVILMDIAMPVLNGLEATRQILAANPAARVLVLSAHSDDAYVEHALAVGAAGFLEKQSSADVLTTAIREVMGGHSYLSPAIRKRQHAGARRPRDRDGFLKPNGKILTAREAEVLQMVTEGSANKQIALDLGISIKTVEKHRQHLMDKLNIHDTAGLTRYAIANGVIESVVQVTVV